MFKTENFDKNIAAMNKEQYNELKKALCELENLNFAFEFDGKDTLNTNIMDIKSGQRLYTQPLNELMNAIEPFKKEFQRYPCLFFYGIGNGILYKTLLQNEFHKRIVVFEDSVELIYMALNLLDFSKALSEERLIIVYAHHYTLTQAQKIFGLSNIATLFKLYNLHIHSNFYLKDEKNIKHINDININAMHSLSLRKVNDPRDALMGIEHYMINLPKMLSNPTLTQLIKKRKNKGKFALLVATGPSLTKQLPLLKKYASKATIFCADSSYSILHKNGIKPDYVLSLERVSETAELFNNDFGEFDKNIIFVFYTLTHPNTIKYLEKNKRNFVITQRPLAFASYLHLAHFDFIEGGMSVMNMAYRFAEKLEFKNIILIGQDLAYSNEGKSHPKDYMYANLGETEFQKNKDNLPKVIAYGGKGEVYTNSFWLLFKEFFENYIFANQKDTATYNCTEGGVRIDGAIEKPFKEVCEEFLAKEKDKTPLPKLTKPTRKQSSEDMLRVYKLIKEGQKYTANFIRACKKVQRQINNLVYGKQKETLDEINKNIDKLKKRLNRRKSLFCNEILSPSLAHQEAALAPLYAQSFENETERQNKLLMWIYSHEAWVEELIDLLEVFEESVKTHIVPLREELERRKVL